MTIWSPRQNFFIILPIIILPNLFGNAEKGGQDYVGQDDGNPVGVNWEVEVSALLRFPLIVC